MERHMIDSRPRVRVASCDDISALQELISQSYLFLCRRYYTPKQIECALAHHVGIDKQMIDDGTYYVAEIDGEIVGCGGWSKRKKPFGGARVKTREILTCLTPPTIPLLSEEYLCIRVGLGGGSKRASWNVARGQPGKPTFGTSRSSRRRWPSLYIPRADSRRLRLSSTASPMDSLLQRFACSRALIRKLIVGSCGPDPRTEMGRW